MQLTDILQIVVSTLAAGGLLVFALAWLLKTWLGERIRQSIQDEYARSLTQFEAAMRVRTGHEESLLNGVLERYWQLGALAAEIAHNTTQLTVRAIGKWGSLLREGLDESSVRQEVNEFFEPESLDILKSAVSLKSHYVLLPTSVIEALQEFETRTWIVLKQQKFEEIAGVYASFEALLSSIREVSAKLLVGTVSFHELIRESPAAGFTPPYIRAALSRNAD